MRKAALQAIYELARRDERVVFIGSDLGAGILDAMRQEMPERFFMEGVCEAAIIGMAAGLALDGFIPFVNTIATFITRRAYEQVAIDLCLHNLPVRLIASGGGTVYAPLGPTHMAVEDIAALRCLPNMTIVAPADAPEMRRTINSTVQIPGPVYVRIAKGGEPIISDPSVSFTIGTGITMRGGRDVLLVATGVMTHAALDAASDLVRDGIDAGVFHVHTIKPLDIEGLFAAAAGVRLVVSLEEHTRIGGLGSAIAEAFADALIHKPLVRLGLPDRFSRDYGSSAYVLERAGLDAASIANTVREQLRSQLTTTAPRA